MPRARDLGIRIGALPTGPTNSVLDVPGVGVGHATVHRDEPDPPAGRGVARTGVTAVVLAEDAYVRPVPAGGAVLNGAGECTGFLTAASGARRETPVYLTSTMQLGRVYDAACEIELEGDPDVADDVVIPIVGECDDSWLNDCRRMQVTADDVRAARAAALASRGAPLASRRGRGRGRHRHVLPGLQGRHRYGVTGHPRGPHRRRTAADELRQPRPAGRRGRPGRAAARPGARSGRRPAAPAGSCIGLVVTDAPVDGAACQRLARRIGLGLARTGSVAHNGSGEIFLGFGTGMRHGPRRPPRPHRPGRRPRASTRCSPRSSRPPRRRC